MYKVLIVGYCDTDEGRDALALGHMLAQATGSQVLTASVLHGSLAAEAPKAAELVRAAATSASPESTARARVVQDRSPARGLHNLAEQERADAVVLGSTHRGTLGRVLAGSVAERLLSGGPCAVAVAPRGYREEDFASLPRVIALGFDGFPESRRALALAGELAQACGATLRVMTVEEPYVVFGYRDPAAEGAQWVESERKRLQKELNDALEQLPSELRAHGAVLSGRAAEVLADVAEKGVDLLVVGSRGYGPIARVMLGGVSSALMRSSPCPVLVVPRSAAPGLAEPARHVTAAPRPTRAS
jgi:nucleotide-binding universal stress UspA family protein